ncbi:MAG: hypothetical protein WCY24_03390 [Lutispora sp.]|nr:hypothetical protein [Lutispora sp.]MDD4834968.1 hypothetical protein [Lutispora sp.]
MIKGDTDGSKIQKYGVWGLLIFVGNLIAAAIIVTLSNGVIWIFR